MDTWLQFRLYHAVPIDSQRNLWDDRQYDRTRLWQPASHVRKSGGANMSFKEMKPEELQKNPFTMIGREWLLVTAEKDGKANTMTASWGGVGVMWGKNVAFIVIRPQRYTKEFIDGSEGFSLSVLDETFRKTYSYLGSVSGRDEDKIAKSGLTLSHEGATPYFEEANTVLVCRKLYAQEYTPDCFLDNTPNDKWYPDKDYHTMYFSEIEKVLVRE